MQQGSPNNSFIYADNLSIGYNRKALFRPVTLAIPRGTFNALIGANGSGKSTLLHTLGGTLPPVHGIITIGGRNISGLSNRQLAQTTGLVYTERYSAGGLTVRELVEMGRHPYTGFLGRLSKADNDVVSKSMADVGISHKSDSFLSDISDGERQKAMIARALAQQTPLLLLDEPTNFLDAASRIEVLNLVSRLIKTSGITAVLSTHDASTALRLADNVITILPDDDNPVSIDACGTPEATRRLKHIFADRGVDYDPDRLDFILRP